MTVLVHWGPVLGKASSLHGIIILKCLGTVPSNRNPSHCIHGWKESELRKYQFIERENFNRNRLVPGKLVHLVQDGTEPGKAFPR